MKKITIILLGLSASIAFADRITKMTDEQRKQEYDSHSSNRWLHCHKNSLIPDWDV